MTGEPALFVEAPARLHFGVLDLRGDLGRRFGGIGAAVPAPSLLLEARPATRLAAEGPDAPRVLEFARTVPRLPEFEAKAAPAPAPPKPGKKRR